MVLINGNWNTNSDKTREDTSICACTSNNSQAVRFPDHHTDTINVTLKTGKEGFREHSLNFSALRARTCSRAFANGCIWGSRLRAAGVRSPDRAGR